MIPGILGSTGRFLDIAALPNCALWIDASDASTITHSSGSVSQINDKSGNGRHLTQGTSTNQPRIDTHTQNGLAVLDFDGVNDCLLLGANDICRNVAGFTVYVVAQVDYVGSVTQFVFLASGWWPTASRVLMEVGQVTANKPGVGGRILDSDSLVLVEAADDYPAIYTVYAGVFDYSNSDLYLYLNNNQKAVQNSFGSAGNTSNTASTGLAVGGNVIGTVFFDGQIAEIAMFDRAHTFDERALVWAYLSRKWGLS